jgi:hypothetical protein
MAFSRFHTPEQLALALGSDDDEERELAEWAMRNIIHLGYQRRYTGRVEELRERVGRQVIFIAKQETLSDDWERLKGILELPPDLDLISDPRLAHRRLEGPTPKLDRAAVRNLRRWYARDYDLMAGIDEIRAEQGWGPKLRAKRAARRVRRGAGRARRRIAGGRPGDGRA